MENQTLKHISDRLSKRLHMWEVNSQTSSLALQQSLKATMHQHMDSPSPISSASPVAHTSSPQSTSSSRSIAELEQRIKDLEAGARMGERDLDRQTRENERLRITLTRYRDRWEKLKEDAKNRRASGKSSTANPNSNLATPGPSTNDGEVNDDQNNNDKDNSADGNAETKKPEEAKPVGEEGKPVGEEGIGEAGPVSSAGAEAGLEGGPGERSGTEAAEG